MRLEVVERLGEDAVRNENDFWGVQAAPHTIGALNPGNVLPRKLAALERPRATVNAGADRVNLHGGTRIETEKRMRSPTNPTRQPFDEAHQQGHCA